VRAALGVQAGSREAEALDGTAMQKVLDDNFIHIFELHKAVPDGLGIDHDDGAVLALIEAAGLVGTDEMLEARIFDGVLERGFELFAAAGKAAWAGRVLVTLVGANKEVMLKFRQWLSSLPFALCGLDVRPARLSETIWNQCNLTILSRLKTTW
jgi:hypothetical protein